MLGGTFAPPRIRWSSARRHIVTDTAPANSPRHQRATGEVSSEPSSPRPLSPGATPLEIVAYMRQAGPLAVSKLAEAMGVEQGAAWERLQFLKRLGLVRRDCGEWSVAATGAHATFTST